MTDPIEQAHGRRISARMAPCDDCEFEPWIETVGGLHLCTQHYEGRLEQAILHHHPDVVRLVLAARRAVPILDAGRGSPQEWTQRADASANSITAALVPFTEVQE